MSQYKALEALSEDLTALIEKTGPWVVSVCGGRGPNSSGILWDSQHVLTTEHGLGQEDQVEVGLASGQTVAATILGRMPGWDLALLRLSAAQDRDPPLWTEQAVPGLVVSLGRQARGTILSSLGMLNSAEAELSHRSPLGPEFAGGPLLNARGEMLGINGHGRPPEAVPYRRLKGVVEQLKDGRSVEPSFLGLGLLPLEHGGCLVIRVEPGSPAEKGRVMVGDQLRQLNDQEVHGPEDVQRELRSLPAGQSVTLVLSRAGQPLEISVLLESRPARGGPGFFRPGPHGEFPPGGFPGPGGFMGPGGPPGRKLLKRIRHILHHGPPGGPCGTGPAGPHPPHDGPEMC